MFCFSLQECLKSQNAKIQTFDNHKLQHYDFKYFTLRIYIGTYFNILVCYDIKYYILILLYILMFNIIIQ